MRHRTLRLVTLLVLAAGGILVLATVARPVPAQLAGTLVQPTQVYRLRAAHFLRMRAFQEVFERCETLIGEGKDIVCPNVNDAAGARAFMESEDGMVSPTHEAAPPVLGMDDLSDHQTAVLRRMVRVGHCDEARLNAIVPGLYDLCIAVAGPAGEHGAMQRLLESAVPRPEQQERATWTLEEFLRAFGGKARPDR